MVANRSFIPVASDSDFPIQNLPFGAFRADGETRLAVRVGDHVVDLRALAEAGLFDAGDVACSLAAPTLNAFMGLGRSAWRDTRATLLRLLAEDEARLRDDTALRDRAIRSIDDVDPTMPVAIGDYTDFYSSKEHATNVGIMFRGKDNALMPNWLHMPIAYHGRASSVVLSGTPVHRPSGQTKVDDADAPSFGPCRLLDYEYEMGFFTGPASTLGHPVSIDHAREHIFGMCIVNDWSARDIQKWEYQPLGPFLAKNFATTISPWIVTLEALEPFKCAGPTQDPEPLPYLRGTGDQTYDIKLEVYLQTPTMSEPARISHANFRYLYWSMCQQLTHHTVTGCSINPGDLMASGTISGPTKESRGSMLELCWRGTEPVSLPNGEERKFLQDGDTLIMRAHCEGDGYRIGFGECRGTIQPANV